ncbi:MAG TPA: type IV toxin-antitoxin system AbiEi family antitoxin domain-containing protein [Puia sp.]|nr:type IV toxin-antitoxin system AbiEi family antitoxin domain-containing protein [Puia sp.]
MSFKSINKTGLSHQERLIIDTFVSQDRQILRTEDLLNLLKPSSSNPHLILSRLAKKGWLQRLRSGIYRIVPLGSDSSNPIPEDAWYIASKIFAPCYIGGWSAAEHWDLTEQIYNSTIVFTGKKQRTIRHNIAGLLFETHFISENHIFGIQKIWSNNQPIQISDLHRTLIDIFHNPSIGGGGRALIDIAKAYTKKKEFDPEKLWQYAIQLESGAVFKRLGMVGEKILNMPAAILDEIQLKCKQGIILLDPQGPKTGQINKRWGIRINIPVADLA